MLFDNMKKGYLGEIFRFQIASIGNIILYVCIFLFFGIISFIFKPLLLFTWILAVITCTFFLTFFSKVLLIYEDGFLIDNVKNLSDKRKRLRPKINFKDMEYVLVHIGGFRGNNNFTFYYYVANHLKGKSSFMVSDVSTTIAPLRFLYANNVQIYVDDARFGEKIFDVKSSNLFLKNLKNKTWYTIEQVSY